MIPKIANDIPSQAPIKGKKLIEEKLVPNFLKKTFAVPFEAFDF